MPHSLCPHHSLALLAPPPSLRSNSERFPGQIAVIISLGYLFRRNGTFSTSDMAGINKLLTSVALPAVFFLSLATLDWGAVSFALLGALCLSKTAVYILTALVTYYGTRCRLRMSLSGLYAIFTTKSNDIAMGIPILSSIFGQNMASYLYLFSPYQLLVINLFGLSQMQIDMGRRNKRKVSGAISGRVIEEDDSGFCDALLRLLLSLGREPIIVSCVLGIAFNLIFGHNALPGFFDGLLSILSQIYSGAALFALGLSLQLGGNGDDIDYSTVTLLVMTKVLLLPFVMALVAEAFTGNQTDFQFAFIYGMIPTAPTVYIFAVKYAVREALTATACFICLILSVPVLMVAALSLEIQQSDRNRSNDLTIDSALVATSLSIAAASFILVIGFVSRRSRDVPNETRLAVFVAVFFLAEALIKVICIESSMGDTAAVATQCMFIIVNLGMRLYTLSLAASLYASVKSPFLQAQYNTALRVAPAVIAVIIGVVCAVVPPLRPNHSNVGREDADYLETTILCSTKMGSAHKILQICLNAIIASATLLFLLKYRSVLTQQRYRRGSSIHIDEEKSGTEYVPLPNDFEAKTREQRGSTDIPEFGEGEVLPRVNDGGAECRFGEYDEITDAAEMTQENMWKERMRESNRYTMMLLYVVVGELVTCVAKISDLRKLEEVSPSFIQVVTLCDILFNYSFGMLMFAVYVGHPHHTDTMTEISAKLNAMCPCWQSLAKINIFSSGYRSYLLQGPNEEKGDRQNRGGPTIIRPRLARRSRRKSHETAASARYSPVRRPFPGSSLSLPGRSSRERQRSSSAGAMDDTRALAGSPDGFNFRTQRMADVVAFASDQTVADNVTTGPGSINASPAQVLAPAHATSRDVAVSSQVEGKDVEYEDINETQQVEYVGGVRKSKRPYRRASSIEDFRKVDTRGLLIQ